MSEDDLLELVVAFLPETLEGWAAVAVLACLVVSLVVPAPSEDSHPAWIIGHRLIRILGLGAGKLRGAGKIGKLFRRRW